MANPKAVGLGVVKVTPNNALHKPDPVVTLSQIAQELSMDAKVARAKLRRAKDMPPSAETRWVFAVKDVAAVKAILAGDARKK